MEVVSDGFSVLKAEQAGLAGVLEAGVREGEDSRRTLSSEEEFTK